MISKFFKDSYLFDNEKPDEDNNEADQCYRKNTKIIGHSVEYSQEEIQRSKANSQHACSPLKNRVFYVQSL